LKRNSPIIFNLATSTKNTVMTLLAEVEKYVTGILEDTESKGFTYHNLKHTHEVAEVAALIGKNSHLTPEEIEIVKLAAWFHDVGYTVNYHDHETESIRMAREFLASREAGKEVVQSVIRCIEATKMPQSPHNILEEIVCDADMFHLSHKDCLETSLMLRTERNSHRSQKISVYTFMLETLELLKLPYFTAYARRHWGKGKETNRNLLEDMLTVMSRDKDGKMPSGDTSQQESSGNPDIPER
jgi:HD superfamily phosphodiesterase